MSKVIGFVIAAVEIGVGIATGNPELIVQGVMTAVAQAAVDLTAEKQPARDASEMGISLGEQPRCMQIGETFTPGSLVDGFNYGGKYGTDWEVLVIRLADEPCAGLTGFYVDDTYVPYTGDGNYAQFDGHHFSLWFRWNTSLVPLPAVVIDHGPGWTAADIGRSGCDVVVAYLADSPKAKKPAWPGGRPHFGFVLKGGFRYDPRKDDTVAGGAGAHRIDDPSTWEWSQNAMINWYAFERGIYVDGDRSDPSNLLVGRGMTAEESPPENIFAGANLCDEIVASVFPFAILAGGLTLGGSSYSPDLTKLIIVNGTDFQVWYMPTRTLIASASLAHNMGTSHVAVNADGSSYASSGVAGGVFLISPTGSESQVSTGQISGGIWNLAAGIFGRSTIPVDSLLQLVGSAVITTPIGFTPDWYVDDQAGNSFAVGGKLSGGSYINGFGFRDLVAGADHLVATSTSGPTYALDNGSGHWFVRQGTSCYLIDKVTYAIVAGPVVYSAYAVGEEPFQSARAGDRDIWLAYTRVSTLDLSAIETVNPADWATSTGASGNPTYDRVNDAILTKSTLESGITVRFLHRQGGYRVAGPIYSNQEYLAVEAMFEDATAGNIVTHEGAVLLEPGQAKSVVATITDADLLIGSKISWNHGILSGANQDWLNTTVANYVEPDLKWNAHDTAPLRDEADIIADGKPREQQLSLRFVRYQAQALRVAEIRRRLGRLLGRAGMTLGPRHCELEEGDWIAWQSDLFNFTKIFRIDGYQIDRKWQNTPSLREISGSVYADDATFPTDHSVPTTTTPPPDIGTPVEANWTLSAVTLDSPGASVPALHIEGSSDDDGYVEAIIFEYWLDDGVTDPAADPDTIPWTSAGRFPPATTTVDITSVVGAESYYAAVSYVVSGITGDRLVIGPVTLAGIGTGIRTADTTFITADSTTRKADIG